MPTPVIIARAFGSVDLPSITHMRVPFKILCKHASVSVPDERFHARYFAGKDPTGKNNADFAEFAFSKSKRYIHASFI